jgi:hypothetical protein
MNNQETRFFCIGEHYVKVNFLDTKHNNMNLMRSYYPFLVDSAEGHDLLFEITIDDDLKPIPKAQRERIREFETGNGSIIVDELEMGGHQFIFKDMEGIECSMFQITPDGKQVKCALTGNYDMRSFGIHNAMMLSYAVAGSFKDTVLIHASLVRQNGYGYAFHAISGTGKSTQVSMWLRFLPGCDLMNDDNPVIRVIDGKPYIYGSPWSGKTPCYRNIKAPLGALTRIDRDDHNWVEPLSPIEAFTSVLPSCSSLKWDVPTYHRVGDTVSKIVQKTKVSILHCLPNREAAEVCNAAIAVK